MQIITIIIWTTVGLINLFGPQKEVHKLIFGLAWANLMMLLVANAINRG